MASVASIPLSTCAGSAGQAALVTLGKAQSSYEACPSIISDLLKQYVFPAVGDPPTISCVCKNWKKLQGESYKFTLDLYKGQEILSRFVIALPTRISFAKSKVILLYKAIMQQARMVGISPRDFKQNGIAVLALAKQVQIVDQCINAILRGFPNLPPEALKEPLKTLTQYCVALDGESAAIERQHGTVAMSRTAAYTERFHELNSQKVIVAQKVKGLQNLADQAKATAFAPSALAAT